MPLRICEGVFFAVLGIFGVFAGSFYFLIFLGHFYGLPKDFSRLSYGVCRIFGDYLCLREGVYFSTWQQLPMSFLNKWPSNKRHLSKSSQISIYTASNPALSQMPSGFHHHRINAVRLNVAIRVRLQSLSYKQMEYCNSKVVAARAQPQQNGYIGYASFTFG